MADGEVAFYNFDRALTSLAPTQLCDILIDLNLPSNERLATARVDSNTKLADLRHQFIATVIGLNPHDAGQLQEAVADQAEALTAPWAAHFMDYQVDNGVEICLYSQSLPKQVLAAYAHGLSAEWPKNISDNLVVAPSFAADRRGQVQRSHIRKTETLTALHKNRNLSFVADSFDVMRQVLNQVGISEDVLLWVNPEPKALEANKRTLHRPVLWWGRHDQPATYTKIELNEQARDDHIFDLTLETDSADFVHHLAYVMASSASRSPTTG